MTHLNPDDFIITRKRKLYKFALFSNSPLCFEFEQWTDQPPANVMELGAGTGLFSVALAGTHPGQQVLAVDVKADRLQTGAQLAADQSVKNVRFLRARANQLADIVPAQSMEAIWVTFADPFPKTRTAKHRLTHPQYLSLYQQLLQPSGALYVKHDNATFFNWSLEQLVACGWRIEELSFDLHESTLDDSYKVLTTYEKRWLSEGLVTQFFKATPPAR